MWVTGIMEGLMWREVDAHGFLVNSFADTVAAKFPDVCGARHGRHALPRGRAHHALEPLADDAAARARGRAPGRGARRAGRRQPAGPEVGAPEAHRGWFTRNHARIERNATLLLVLSFVVVTVGGIVEIAPLFWLQNTIEKVEGMRPYSPLELAGRQIYVREGCYVCHS